MGSSGIGGWIGYLVGPGTSSGGGGEGAGEGSGEGGGRGRSGSSGRAGVGHVVIAHAPGEALGRSSPSTMSSRLRAILEEDGPSLANPRRSEVLREIGVALGGERVVLGFSWGRHAWLPGRPPGHGKMDRRRSRRRSRHRDVRGAHRAPAPSRLSGESTWLSPKRSSPSRRKRSIEPTPSSFAVSIERREHGGR